MRVTYDGEKARVTPTPYFLTDYSLDYALDDDWKITSAIAGENQISDHLLRSAISTARDYCDNASSKNGRPKRVADSAPVDQPPPKSHRLGSTCSSPDCPLLCQKLEKCCGLACVNEYHRACQAKARTTTVGNQMFCAPCSQAADNAKKQKTRARANAQEEKKREERAKTTEKDTRDRARELAVASRAAQSAVDAPAPSATSASSELILRATLAAEAASSAAAASTKALIAQEHARASSSAASAPPASTMVHIDVLKLFAQQSEASQRNLLQSHKQANEGFAIIVAGMCSGDNVAGVKRANNDMAAAEAKRKAERKAQKRMELEAKHKAELEALLSDDE
jgi:hypothetical protein